MANSATAIHLAKNCEDAAKALNLAGKFPMGQEILREAAEELRRLNLIAYQAKRRHPACCDCINCEPF